MMKNTGIHHAILKNHPSRSGIFIVKFEHVSHIVLALFSIINFEQVNADTSNPAHACKQHANSNHQQSLEKKLTTNGASVHNQKKKNGIKNQSI